MKNKPEIELPCPKCKKKTVRQGNRFFPFCSKRCKLIDLGSWLDGKYVLPENESPPSDEGN
jgi:endogenous inhibitor of DNA gyrase (YacG/DUF329 family)